MRRKSTDALSFIKERYVGTDPAKRKKVEQAYFFAILAQQLYALRIKAGLSQKQLADRIGTSASVISRLEDADYEGGHSLKTVLVIFDALDLELSLVAKPRTGKARPLAKAFGSPHLALAR